RLKTSILLRNCIPILSSPLRKLNIRSIVLDSLCRHLRLYPFPLSNLHHRGATNHPIKVELPSSLQKPLGYSLSLCPQHKVLKAQFSGQSRGIPLPKNSPKLLCGAKHCDSYFLARSNCRGRPMVSFADDARFAVGILHYRYWVQYALSLFFKD